MCPLTNLEKKAETILFFFFLFHLLTERDATWARKAKSEAHWLIFRQLGNS